MVSQHVWSKQTKCSLACNKVSSVESAYCSTSQLSTNDCILLDLFYKLTTVILSVVADVPGDNDAHTVNSFILMITQTLRGAHRIRGACLYSRSDCACVCVTICICTMLWREKNHVKETILGKREQSPFYYLHQTTHFIRLTNAPNLEG